MREQRWKGWACLIAALAGGCAVQPSDSALQKSFTDTSAEPHFQVTSSPAHPSSGLGIGLAGGGTRAAATSIGILAGLQEVGVLQRADVLSTVSGAGYGTYWWYSRFLDLDGYSGVAAAHADCLPQRYANIAPTGTPNACHASTAPQLAPICVPSVTNFDSQCAATDAFRYQNYLRGFQDILGDSDFSYRTIYGDNADALRNGGRLLAHSAIAMVPNFIANILFDWQLNVSPSRIAYRNGINSTFGAPPESCAAKPEGCATKRDRQRPEKRTFEDLAGARMSGAPEWIINAHAGNGRSGLDPSRLQHVEVAAFEFTPKGFGSSVYRFHPPSALEQDFEVVDAVAASAAFFTAQQKEVDVPARNLISLGMLWSTVNWGISINNPNHPTNLTKVVHRLLPLPLYYAHKFEASNDSAFINLADGGLTDNSGAYALLKRKLALWILSDHSYDRSGRMSTVCTLDSNIQRLGFRVLIPGLSKLGKVCNEEGGWGYDVFNWRHPILLGCITSLTGDCETANARFILIKPALNFRLAETLDPLSEEFRPSENWRAVVTACRDGLEEPNCGDAVRTYGCSNYSFGGMAPTADSKWRFDAPMPCEVMGFLLINGFGRGATTKDSCPGFPQNSSVVMTANSSFSLYGAYRELGRWYARQVRYFISSGKLDKARFDDVMKWQGSAAMIPKEVDMKRAGFVVSPKAGAADDCGFLAGSTQ